MRSAGAPRICEKWTVSTGQLTCKCEPNGTRGVQGARKIAAERPTTPGAWRELRPVFCKRDHWGWSVSGLGCFLSSGHSVPLVFKVIEVFPTSIPARP